MRGGRERERESERERERERDYCVMLQITESVELTFTAMYSLYSVTFTIP